MENKHKPMDRLTIISIAAQKEGISYGKYMAKYKYDPPCLKNLPEETFPPVKGAAIPEHLKNMEPHTPHRALRNCRYCGKPFEPASGNQFHCSQACSREGARAREKQKALAGKTQRYCIICNAPLPLAVSANRLTCSKECSEVHRKNYMREKDKRYKQKKKQKQASEKGA